MPMDETDLTKVPGVFAPEPDNTPVWYGIMFTDTSMTVKRYFSHGDVQEAIDSDFVAHVIRLFTADNRADAMKEAQRLIMALH